MSAGSSAAAGGLDAGALLAASVAASRGLRENLRRTEGADGRKRTLLLAGPVSSAVGTRELCFAAGGLLAAGEEGALRDTLDELIRHQREDGLFPSRLEPAKGGISNGVLPRFGPGPFRPAPDSNSLLVWACSRYAAHTDSVGWAGLVLPALEKGMAYYDGLLEDGFVRQATGSDWKDSSPRGGAVFFTQLLRWKAQRSMEELCRSLGREKAAERWKALSHRLERLLQLRFWDGEQGWFVETLDRPGFSSEANLAAADWGLAQEEQSSRIVRAVSRLGLSTPWGPKTSQRYPLLRKGAFRVLAGVPGLHDDGVWPWVGALYLRVLLRLGRRAVLEEAARGLCGLVGEDGRVCEVYDPERGRPLVSPLFHPERPSTWSCGALLEAFQLLLSGSATSGPLDKAGESS